MKCWNCLNAKSLPGDCHISCANPPQTQLEIGSGGNERYQLADEMAQKDNAVVRCIWPSSGFFPFAFDGNTVFGCASYQEKNKNNK